MTTTNQDLANHAQAIIDLLEREGWIQGKLHIPESGYCIVGANDKIAGGNVLNDLSWTFRVQFNEFLIKRLIGMERFRQLEQLIKPLMGSSAHHWFMSRNNKQLPGHIAAWNDMPGRTIEQVLEALRDFISEVKGRE